MRDRLSYTVVPFGYWAKEEADTSEFPWPVITGVSDPDFLGRLTIVETALKTGAVKGGGVMRFMGRTVSRLTGEPLGNAEFYVHDDAARTRFVWPQDFGSHYLAAGVAAPSRFVELIEILQSQLRNDESPSCGGLR